MPDVPQLSALELLRRWDDQQTVYIRHRAHRFDTIARTVARFGGERPRILDLAAGPGSLSRLMRDRLPACQVVAVDKDPVLLSIADEVFADDPAVEVVDADLDSPAWLERVSGSFDAVVSSTALHWLVPHVLVRTYGELAGLIRPGGVFLNGDHLLYDATANAGLRQLAAADDERTQAELRATGADSWDAWWELANGQSRYAEAALARERVWRDRSGPVPKVSLGFHLETLRSTGFGEVGTVWQYFDDYVVAGIR
ncbi:MAG: class I SAM-dependent methyltransferase [Propionicimonas sp.]|uniref:class I SAM-dependent methyltransferase n=1 Tax=Propionicimonas sp. TaxID=1955623 RepID=UPI002B20DED2|nr:class I SAM-dependent methyltransferase [Propionicimonas sp.]MEA4944859.1 class I SAM-dependent methyltransferase [Propionicimonas sp.]MEA5116465.1 class I SAM-dependent methyltransferase [Propionicimonas sp.]